MKSLLISIRYIFLIFLLLASGSCNDDFLDRPPEDALVIDNFYSTPEQINASTLALYGFPWFDINDKALWSIGDAMAGNMVWGDGDIGQFVRFSVTQNNPHLFEAWSSLYRVIAYANSVILNVGNQAPEDISADLVNRALAEGHFMRGISYFYLVRLFGPVPIIEDNSQFAFNPLIPKHRVDDVYTLIIRDLEFAEEHLEESYAGRNQGRVTTWAAKALLAKVHLTLQDYDGAMAYADEVITNSGLTLLPDYADLFRTEFNNNQESLFSLQWMSCLDWGTQNSNQAYFARNSMLTGVGDGWGGGSGPSIDLQLAYEPNDKRKKPSIMSFGDHYPDLLISKGGYTYDIVNRDEGRGPTNAHLKKYVVGTPEDNGGEVCFMSTGINTYMIRLADAYLTYTEAAIGSKNSTTDAKAVNYFNRIRQRAGLPALETVTYMDLLKERRLEFAFESQFWYDLLRFYNRDPQAMLDYVGRQERGTFLQKENWEGEDNDPDAYEVNSRKYPLSVDRLFLPIPTVEVDLNPMLAPEETAQPYNFN